MGSSHHTERSSSSQIEVLPLTTQILSMIFSLTGFILSVACVAGCHFFEVSASALEIGSSFSAFGGLFKYDRIGGLGQDTFTWNSDCTSYPDKAREWNINDLVPSDSSTNNYDTSSYGGTSSYSGTTTGPFVIDMVPSLHQGAYMISKEPSFKAAQAMGAICAFVAGLAMIGCFLMFFLKLPRCAFKTLSGCFFFCFVTQLLVFLVLDNDVCNGTINDQVLTLLDVDVGLTCDLSTDAHYAIASSVFFLTLGVMIIICPTPQKSVIKAFCDACSEQKYVSQQVSPSSVTLPSGNNVPTHTEIYNPDGSVTVKEERVNRDGTKSIVMTSRNVASI